MKYFADQCRHRCSWFSDADSLSIRQLAQSLPPKISLLPKGCVTAHNVTRAPVFASGLRLDAGAASYQHRVAINLNLTYLGANTLSDFFEHYFRPRSRVCANAGFNVLLDRGVAVNSFEIHTFSPSRTHIDKMENDRVSDRLQDLERQQSIGDTVTQWRANFVRSGSSFVTTCCMARAHKDNVCVL